MIEQEKGEGHEVDSEDSQKVETNVDVGPSKVIQHIAVVGPLLITNNVSFQVIVFKNLLLIKKHLSAIPHPRLQCDYRTAGCRKVELLG